MAQIRAPMVCVMLDALHPDGRPCSHFDQKQQPAPCSRAEFERYLPPARASAMLQRATELNRGIGIDRWIFREEDAATRPSLLERAWSFDMCQVFNMAAALALRAFLSERRGALRLPSGERVGFEGVHIVQGRPPPPSHGVHMGFVYTCAERGIGLSGARLMGASHLWIELQAECGATACTALSVDFSCHQFGLGDSVDSVGWQPPRAQPSDGPADRHAAPSQVQAPHGGSMRAWAQVEQAGEGVLPQAQWRADSTAMAQMDEAGARGCGLESCCHCAGRVFGGHGHPRRARKGELDPLSELLHGADWEAWCDGGKVGCGATVSPSAAAAPAAHNEGRSKPSAQGQAHPCRTLMVALLATLRETFPLL